MNKIVLGGGEGIHALPFHKIHKDNVPWMTMNSSNCIKKLNDISNKIKPFCKILYPVAKLKVCSVKEKLNLKLGSCKEAHISGKNDYGTLLFNLFTAK